MPLKKILLTLIAFGLISSFQASLISDYTLENSEIVDASSDKNDSEKESEDSKLLSSETIDFGILRIAILLDIQRSAALQQNFSQVLTSPPNA